jgi:hypothetical protein
MHTHIYMEMVHDRCSTLLTEFGTALTTILPFSFQYCYKYCYSDSRKLWAVMKAGGLALHLHQHPRVTWSILTTKVNVKTLLRHTLIKNIFEILCLNPVENLCSKIKITMVHDRCSTLLTEFGTALTTILPFSFQYCYTYCYSDSGNFEP